MREILSGCKNITFIDTSLTVKSAVKKDQLAVIDQMVKEIVATMPFTTQVSHVAPGEVDKNAMFKLSYGLFVLTAKTGIRITAASSTPRPRSPRIPTGLPLR